MPTKRGRAKGRPSPDPRRRPPLVFSAIRQVARAAEGMTFQAAMNMITKRQFETVDRLYDSEDNMEGFRAFAEKRAPVWKGRLWG